MTASVKTFVAKTFLFFLSMSLLLSINTSKAQSSTLEWPDSVPWWKANNLRVIQTNLPAYEAAILDPDSLVADLKYFSANTLIINAGGIMAFYPTQLEYHYSNPYMKENMLGEEIGRASCRERGQI